MSRWLLAFVVLMACRGPRAPILDSDLPKDPDNVSGDSSMPAPWTKSTGPAVSFPQSDGEAAQLTIEGWEQKTHTRVDEKVRTHVLIELSNRPPDERDALARTYLYEVRELKLKSVGQAKALTLDDLQRLPPQTYLAGFGPAIGWLRAGSKPEGGSISIDGVERGATVREFTLDTGEHTVTITVPSQTCDEVVTIKKKEWSVVKCPK